MRLHRPPNRIACGVLAFWVFASPTLGHPDLDRQISDITSRIEADPGNADLFLQRGELHRIHQDWEAAEADFESARRLRRDLAVVDYLMGRLHLDAGRPKQAKRALDRFLAREPDHAAAHVARARALARLDQPLAAARDLTVAIDLHGGEDRPDPSYYLERAQALAGAGRIDEAIGGLDAGLARLGEPVTLQLAAIDLELARGRHDAALARLDRLGAGAARQETWLVRRGAILEGAGRLDEAGAAYADALAAIDRLPPSRQGSRAMARLREEAAAGAERVRHSAGKAEGG
jgi:predicted Zn-dependent protease